MHKLWKNLFILLTIFPGFAQAELTACGGHDALLDLIDRPTISYSACVVPIKTAVLETGYQYIALMGSAGYQFNLPQAELRVGIPGDNEFIIFFPNYNHQSKPSENGYASTSIGMKHQLVNSGKWASALGFLIFQPNGNAVFGNKQTGLQINSMTGYNISDRWSVLVMLSLTLDSMPSSQGGQHFTSFNPDVVITYAISHTLNFYGEFFSQTRTSSTTGFGSLFDGGFTWLPFTWLELDAEFGQRITGNQNNFHQYVGVGGSIWF